MRFINIANVAGRICRLFGAAFAAPAVVAAFYGEWADIPGFVLGGVVSGGIGQALLAVSRGADDDLRRIEALSVVSGVWLLFAVLCSIPYLWVGFGVIDALFEAMSCITATGATILTDFEAPGAGPVLLAGDDPVDWRHGRHHPGRRGPAAARRRGPATVRRRSPWPHGRDAGAAGPEDRGPAMAPLRGSDRGRGGRARLGRHAVVRCGVSRHDERWRPAASRRTRSPSWATTAPPSSGSSASSCSWPAPTSRCSTGRCSAVRACCSGTTSFGPTRGSSRWPRGPRAAAVDRRG